MSVELTDDQYLESILRRPPRRRFSIGGCAIWTICLALGIATLIGISLNIAGKLGIPVPAIPPALVDALAGKSQTTFGAPPQSNEGPSGAPAQQQPASAPLIPPGAAPWPTLTPEPTGVANPTLTLPPVPTPSPSFWTEEELAQMTATAEAFYTVIPTAPSAFVEYVDERCKDAGAVEESATLQLFCRK